MASANNWHGFSPSPQTSINASHETSPAQSAAEHLSGKDADGYGSGVNFRPDGCSFSGVDALSSTPQGWSMKCFELKGSASELSMLVDSSGGKRLHGMNNVIEGKPKLEDFLGAASDSFSGHHETTMADHLHSNCCSVLIPGVSSNNGGNGSMGVSMVKTWLRNQPAPPESVLECPGESTQCLALSMNRSALSQSSSPCEKGASTLPENGGGLSCGIDGQAGALESVQRKSTDTFGQRTSIYRGVTRHRWTGRYEAHLWDSSCRREGQTRKGRQVYLGGYDREEKAARAYDLAAIKYWGAATTTNFPVSNYEEEVEQMKRMSRQEYVASLRRKSSGFSRGASIYRGVTRHHQNGRWQARIGRVAGNKDLYLGTFGTQEEAAEAYDIAAIKFRGLNAVTNFDMSRYDVKSILESSSLPFGGATKRLKDVFDHSKMDRQCLHDSSTSALHFLASYAASSQHHVWPTIAFQQPLHMGLPYYNLYAAGEQRGWYKPEPDAATGQGIQSIERQIQFQSTTHNFCGFQTIEGVESSGYGWSGNMISMRAKMAGGATAVGGGGGGIENSQVKTGMVVNMLAGDSDAYYPISVLKEGGYDNVNGWAVNTSPAVGPRPGR